RHVQPGMTVARATRPISQRTNRDSGDPPDAPGAEPLSSGSEALPEPDPAELRSPGGGKAADYAVGDLIDGRFEILALLGQGGFSKVYRVRDDVEGEDRALKLFDSAE